MSTIIDYIGSTVFFGFLILTIGRVQLNLNSCQHQATYNVMTQRNAVALAQQIEFDFAKIGYGAGASKITGATENSITFRSDLSNNGNVDVILYNIGTLSESEMTSHPSDFPLKRRDSRGEIVQQIGLTVFSLSYFDSLNTQMAVPITHPDSIARIRSIEVTLRVENRDPIISGTDTTYDAINWQKLIYPRSLSN